MDLFQTQSFIVLFTLFMHETAAVCPPEQYLTASGKCERCTQCIRKQETIQDCSPTDNRICACPQDTFFHLRKITCDRCVVCEAGYKMVAKCTATENTKCIRCPRGTTSLGNNTTECTKINKSNSGTTCNTSWTWFVFMLSWLFILR